MLVIDPNKPPTRKHTYYACKRCGEINDEYDAFAAGSVDNPKYYCRKHVPLIARIKIRIKRL